MSCTANELVSAKDSVHGPEGMGADSIESLTLKLFGADGGDGKAISMLGSDSNPKLLMALRIMKFVAPVKLELANVKLVTVPQFVDEE